VLIEIAGHTTQVAFDFCHDLRGDVVRESGTNNGQRFEALMQDLPGSLAVRENEERGSHDLEGRAGGATWEFGANRLRGQHRAQIAHHPVHQMLGRFGQRLELLGRLAVMHEIPALDLEDDFVDGIEQVGDAARQLILDRQEVVEETPA